ncbi:MAG: hypothetical protein Q9202_004382 [Teloschistes flavicans]
MPSAVPVTGSEPTNDDPDDLLDYNVNIDDIFRDFNASKNADNADRGAQQKIKGDSLGLGIDEEIKVAPKRQPVAKLHKERLLSQAGVPKLRQLAKDRFKFKGKGHEYPDLARLLNIYQLWLDDLYPRAKFADGLAIIEKLGHTKPIQVMRREWIDEGKPREAYLDMETSREAQNLERGGRIPREKGNGADQPPTNLGKDAPFAGSDSNYEDLYSVSPRQKRDKATQQQPVEPAETLFLPIANDDEHPPEDDLDALLAEDDIQIEKQLIISNDHSEEKTNESSPRDTFEDEMEAMAEMDDW